ncbi:unnamed protein product [Moneuplotes crassus]|uniref:Uncharacterized protein n=1 Tax=Euplotes crassus TaxID=5936 RepID=A0AAD1YDM7_EUPCR|nr:unnamed protein product [Moneuplotes crassus]
MADSDKRVQKLLIRLNAKHHKANSHDFAFTPSNSNRNSLFKKDLASRRRIALNKFEDVLRRNEETLGKLHNGTPKVARRVIKNKRDIFINSKKKVVSHDEPPLPPILSQSRSTQESLRFKNSLIPKSNKVIPMLANFSEMFNMKRIQIRDKRRKGVVFNNSLSTKLENLIVPAKRTTVTPVRKALDIAREVLEDVKESQNKLKKYIQRPKEDVERPDVSGITKKIRILRKKKTQDGHHCFSKVLLQFRKKQNSQKQLNPPYLNLGQERSLPLL